MIKSSIKCSKTSCLKVLFEQHQLGLHLFSQIYKTVLSIRFQAALPYVLFLLVLFLHFKIPNKSIFFEFWSKFSYLFDIKYGWPQRLCSQPWEGSAGASRPLPPYSIKCLTHLTLLGNLSIFLLYFFNIIQHFFPSFFLGKHHYNRWNLCFNLTMPM